MLLKNKKTGEIPEKIETITYIQRFKNIVMVYINRDGERIMKQYDSLEVFNEEWEDASEEPKQWYGLNAIRDVGFEPLEYEGFEDLFKHAKKLGIAFDTKKEVEQAVEKLKAFKRLKDKGFRFNGWLREHENGSADITIASLIDEDYDITDDLNLLFGGEK